MKYLFRMRRETKMEKIAVPQMKQKTFSNIHLN